MSRRAADFSKDAALDLSDIFEFISADNPAAADRVISLILDCAERLAESPYMGRT